MKKMTKVGLSALAGALAFTSAQAGDMSISGSMITSYTKKGGYNITGNPFGMSKAITVTASGELDNGVAVAYKQTLTDANAYGDSELVFTNVPFLGAGTLAMTSTGSPISAIDDVTPIAFEEANASVGSIDDVNGMDGTYGLRYTLADAFGTGMTLDAMYTPKHGAGDAAAEKGTNAGTPGAAEGYEVVIKGAVPGIEGLDIGAGYALLSNDAILAGDQDQDEGTAYVKYAVGGFTLGYQKGAVGIDGLTETHYVNEYIGVSYAISDNLSVSYNEIESRKSDRGASVEQDMDSISLSYTVGGMTIGILDSESDNTSYTTGRTKSARAIQMTIAF
jgi:hypothetical protein